MPSSIYRLRVTRPSKRRLPALAALTVAVAVAVSLGAQSASATTQDFCGTVRASTNSWPGPSTAYCTSSTFSNWTYVSNTYTGGGNITRMRAGMAPYRTYQYIDNSTFLSTCYTGFLTTDYGIINQYEASGASHTLYGHIDDSPNHTGCIGIS